MMRSFRILSLAVLAATIAGAAEAAPRGFGSINEPRSPPAAQPFQPYKPYQGQSTYGGDSVEQLHTLQFAGDAQAHPRNVRPGPVLNSTVRARSAARDPPHPGHAG
jgi:hypothetical protein